MLRTTMEFNLNRGMPGMPAMPPQISNLLLILAVGSIGLGLLLIWNEDLLRWLVAGVFLLIGLLLGLLGLRMRKMFG